MYRLATRLRGSQPFRYVFIGGVSYVVEMAVLLSLAEVFRFSPELAVACSFWVGLVVSFVLQKYIAFGNKNSERKVVGKQVVIYGSLVAFNYFFTIAFVSLFVGLLGLVLARTTALIITTAWNYFVYKSIFRANTPGA